MKKGLSICLSIIMVFMLTVSFSFRSEAAGAYSRVKLSDYTITDTIIVKVYGDEIVISDGKGDTVVMQLGSATGSSCPFSVKIPISTMNGGSDVYATGGTCVYTCRTSFSLKGSYSSGDGVSYSATMADPIIYAGDSSVRCANNSYSQLLFDCSGYYNTNTTLSHIFFLSFSFYLTGAALVHGSQITFTYSITLTNQLLDFYATSDVDSAVLNEAITQQTQTVTSGYDNAGMENSNTALSSSLTDYNQKEDAITDQSVGYIDSAAFIKPSSNATLLTSISFATSWLQSLFVNLGDWSLLVTISLSLSLGLMLIGWFRFRR